MSKLTEYTIELYKVDRRRKDGLRLLDRIEFGPSTKDFINVVVRDYKKAGYVPKLFETYVKQKNLLTGVEFMERYDTPSFCSPSSESYWSM